jgi:hypothetical protein
MKYRVHHGKAGVYGEIAYVEYLDGMKTIARYQMGEAVIVTLHGRDGVGHPRKGFTPEQAVAICEAHMTERGYTERVDETWDIRAYND